MQFIEGNNRNQTCFATLEEQGSADNPVRLIDVFIELRSSIVGLVLS